MFARRDNSFPAPANIKRHEQVELRILVTGESQRRQTLLLDGDSQFLPHFADQTFFRPLSGFDLAARKLPQTGHGFAFRTLGDEHASVRIDKRARGDEDEIHVLKSASDVRRRGVKARSIRAPALPQTPAWL